MKKIVIVLALFIVTMQAAEKPALTSEYLEGKWCYVYQGSPENIENENWEFQKDGKYLQQKSEYNPTMKHIGNWKIEDQKLSIKPVFLGGPHEVKIISQDAFMFKFFVEMHLSRGACKK
jgi:hypothetical protein